MMALGMQEESQQLLESTAVMFPEHCEEVLKKKNKLLPKFQIHVGPDKPYSTITEAVLAAEDGTEILVDPGVYTEALILRKPITLRSSKQTSAPDTFEDSDPRPEIRVRASCAVTCLTKHANKPVCIIGIKVTCHDESTISSHALDVRSGLVVVRNTSLTSSSGPVVCLEDRPLGPCPFLFQPIRSEKEPRLILQSCKIHDGAQGGVLGIHKTALSLRQVHVVGNAASGLELREGGSARVENCHFYDNGLQGITIWKSPGRLDAKHCWIHSHSEESGALVSEGAAYFESCEFYGNGAAGVVSQQRGDLFLDKCMVHDNLDGVLIQDTGSATVEKCDVYRNRANGVHIGQDHRGCATIRDNTVRDNNSRGILVGNKGRNVRISNNAERGNKGLPPQTPAFMWKRVNPSKKYRKRLQKNKPTIEQAMKEQKATGGILDWLPLEAALPFAISDAMDRNCLGCGKSPPKGQYFARCAKCREASYCSQSCQHKDWKRHRISCSHKNIKYPSFTNPDESVR